MASSASQPPRGTPAVLDDSVARKRPHILRLSQEILDEIAVSVALGGYHIESCPESCFAITEWAPTVRSLERPSFPWSRDTIQTKKRFRNYKASKSALLSMMLCCKPLSESARRALYRNLVVSRPRGMLLLLRTLFHRLDIKKSIRHLEISCHAANSHLSPTNQWQYQAWRDMEIDDAFPWLDSFPWIDRLRDARASGFAARVLPLLYLQLLYSTPNLKTLYLGVWAHQNSFDVVLHPEAGFMMRLGEFTESHRVCPFLDSVYLTVKPYTHRVELETFQPLLNLGRVIRFTVHGSTLVTPRIPSTNQSILHSHNILQNIGELTLSNFTFFGWAVGLALFPFDVFVQAKRVRVLRVVNDFFRRQVDALSLASILEQLLCRPCLPGLQVVELGTNEVDSVGLLDVKKLISHSHMTTLRVPLKRLFPEHGWVGKGHPVHNTPQTFINRIVVPEDEPPPTLPPQLAKLILVVADCGRPRSCGPFNLTQWSPREQPIVRGRKWPRVQLCQVLRESAPWLHQVDICIVKGPCPRHGH
ncbi:hypothetical protein V8F33_007357 [Rhypophila sp. PSN 637]